MALLARKLNRRAEPIYNYCISIRAATGLGEQKDKKKQHRHGVS